MSSPKCYINIVVFDLHDNLLKKMAQSLVQTLAQLYISRYFEATVLYRHGDLQGASALLLDLALHPVVQRFLRVNAWTLLSFCTSNMTLARARLLQARDLLFYECQHISDDFLRVNVLVQRTDRLLVQVDAQRRENAAYAQHLAQFSAAKLKYRD